MTAFRHWLSIAPKIDNRERLLEAIDTGQITVTENAKYLVLESISTALDSVTLISDLHPLLLRNRTELPFIFSDAPVVFVNPYYFKVKHRGVLGLQTPGLQIVFPLDTKTSLILTDPSTYDGAGVHALAIDVTEKSDVDQLNALQLHHSLNAVYFGEQSAAPTIHTQWNKCKEKLTDVLSVLKWRKGWLVDGKPVDELMQVFEPQIPHQFRPSFLFCRPIEPWQFEFRHRSPELVHEHKAFDKQRASGRGSARPLRRDNPT